MAIEQSIFDGRRGQKKLKLIEKQKEKVLGEFNTEYENSQEMHFLREAIRWEGAAELVYVMAMRNVHFAWNGLRDLGFLRLCKSWVEDTKTADAAGVKTMTSKDAETMIRTILPEAMWDELNEELLAMEIF